MIRLWPVVAVAACVVWAACDGMPDASLATAPQRGTSASSSQPSPALVGRWSHTEIFMAGGDLRSSQTIWNFRGDASVLRTVIATNVDDGIADRVDASGSWQAQGNTVAITYAPPDTGTVQFTFVVHDSTLTLGGLLFSRIP